MSHSGTSNLAFKERITAALRYCTIGAVIFHNVTAIHDTISILRYVRSDLSFTLSLNVVHNKMPVMKCVF